MNYYCRKLIHHNHVFRRCFFSGPLKAINDKIEIRDHVANAIATKNPVVALESTIITHGMPYPYNVKYRIEFITMVRRLRLYYFL